MIIGSSLKASYPVSGYAVKRSDILYTKSSKSIHKTRASEFEVGVGVGVGVKANRQELELELESSQASRIYKCMKGLQS